MRARLSNRWGMAYGLYVYTKLSPGATPRFYVMYTCKMNYFKSPGGNLRRMRHRVFLYMFESDQALAKRSL